MNNLKHIVTLLALVFAVALPSAAQKKVLTSIGVGGQTYVEINPDDELVYFATAGGTKSVEYKSNTSVTPVSSAAWCKPSVDGNNIVITTEPSTEAAERKATVTVKALDGQETELTVRQLGTNPAFIMEAEDLDLNGYVCNIMLTITANSELVFTLPDWIKAENATTEFTTKNYKFITTPLADKTPRTGTITVSLKADASQQKQIKVTQTFEGFPHFAVISDLHFGAGNASERAIRALGSIYENEPDLDAIIVNGDFTNSGNPSEYEEFQSVINNPEYLPDYVERYIVMGNHEWYASGNPMDNYYTLGHDHLKMFEIKGYPFIYIGLNGGNEGDYSAEALKFLKESLASAAEKYSGKPIFVFSHIGPYETVHGTRSDDGGWGNKSLTEILGNYPQAIHFSGHTHFSIRDTRGIWQGSFTAVNDGSNYRGYIGTGNDEAGITPAGMENVQEAVIVTVDSPDNITIRRIDTHNNVEIPGAWSIPAPYDGTNMPYASYTGGDAPHFESTEVTTESGLVDERIITFPQAVDNDVVLFYRVSVKNAKDEVVGKTTRTSEFYLGNNMPETRTVSIGGLPLDEELYAEIVAVDAYYNTSAPLKSNPFTLGEYTPAEGTVAPEADLLNFYIDDMGTAKDATGKNRIVVGGGKEPNVLYESIYKMNVAQFQGREDMFYRVDYDSSDEMKNAIQNEITLETLFRGNSFNSDWTCPFSSMERGGLGFELDGSRISFYARINGEYAQAESKVNALPGRYYHLVGTFNKAEGKLKLYIDGYPAAEVDVDGEIELPVDGAHWFGIGGDAWISDNRCNAAFNGYVAAAKIYSKAVSRDEAYCMFKVYDNMANAGTGGDEEVTEAPKANLMDIEFGENGAAKDVSPVQSEVVTTSIVPQTYYNETYKRWFAKFGGGDGSHSNEFYRVYYGNSGAIHDAMTGDFSMEVLAVVNNEVGSADNIPAIVSSQESGGFGIEPGIKDENGGDANGDIQIWGNFAGQYETVFSGIKTEKERVYHIIGVVDMENMQMRCYVDGKPAGITSLSSGMSFPQLGNPFFAIGGDSGPIEDLCQYALKGEIGLVRMYDKAITNGEAKILFDELQPKTK